ncbi:hypothetical protein AB0I28_00080 [Phytomonospora sp. NPDC050363]|uniref:hypothetical protein n=1 Tax=Phytomonospora sp. NPDC050363 TaxID=3155642 RepID=UPI003402B13D
MNVELSERPGIGAGDAEAAELAARLADAQSPGGTFLSRVELPWGESEDRNCFVTALVVRELHGIAGDGVAEARRRALAYLLRSRYPVYRDLFSFYPHRGHPFWMRSALYPDADDTAVINLELVRAGLMSTDALAEVAERHLLPNRAVGEGARHLDRPWHREGVFLTWLTGAPVANPVDCCVNTNVVALLAAAGMRTAPGYAEACEMVDAAARDVSRAGVHDRRRTPFYPAPGEWLRALRHAVEMGATELEPAARALATVPDPEAGAEAPAICCDVEGTVVWRSTAVAVARRLRAAAIEKETR